MKKFKQAFVLPIHFVATFALAFMLVSPVSAQAEPARISGDFHTIALTCPPPDDDEQCVIDELGGDLVGTNKLVTTSFVETNRTIAYFDTSTITITAGPYAGMTFEGQEHGVINVQTGEFHSTGRLTSTDGCGSRLITHNNGVIDLNTLEDSGAYQGTIIIKSC
jgi:hypothetical protein